MLPVDRFYLLSHIFISIIGSIILLALWFNIRRRFRKVLEEGGDIRVDKGLAYLSMALITWVIAGIWTFLESIIKIDESLFCMVDSQISALNNFFFLIGLSYSEKAPSLLTKNSRIFKQAIALIALVVIFSAVAFYFFDDDFIEGLRLGYVPDLLLSGFLSILMLLTFYRTLFYRELKIIAIISIAVVLLMFYSQLPQVFLNLHDSFTNNMIKIVAKTSLISIFLVLATTWVIQLASKPVQSEMALSFKDWSLVKISIPSRNINNELVDFGAKTTQFKNLLKFALRRKFAEGAEQCIELKYGGEISRQTYLTRIIENINGILNLSEDQKLDRNDLFTFTGNGRYRLRMLQENIKIEEILQYEFLKDPENKVYEKIVTNCNSSTKKDKLEKISSI